MATRKRKKNYRDFFLSDPCDGLDINSIKPVRLVSRRRYSASIFDKDNIAMELPNGKYKAVSIHFEARKVNNYKTVKLNRYKDRIN